MTWRKSAVRVRYRPPLQNIVEHIACSTFLFIAVMDDNGQRTLLQSNRGAQVFASNSLRSNSSSRCSHYSQNKFGILLSKNLAKVNAMRSSIFHQLPLLRVANLITYFTLCETVFRGPLSSTSSIKGTSRLDLNYFL